MRLICEAVSTKSKSRVGIGLVLGCLLALQACNLTRTLPAGESLLHRQQVSGVPKKLRGKAESQLVTQPNRRIIGLFRLNLWAHQRAQRGKTNRFKRSLAESIGEPPVLFDSVDVSLNQQKIKNVMESAGYYRSEVKTDVKTSRRRKTEVKYTVTPGTQYAIRNIEWPNYANSQANDTILSAIAALQFKTLIKSGEIFSLEKVLAEESRITTALNNEGYYYFNSSFFNFELDTFVGGGKADLFVSLRQSAKPVYYLPFKVGNISIIIDNLAENKQRDFDSIQAKNLTLFIPKSFPLYATTRLYEYNFLLSPGEVYSSAAVTQTEARFSTLDLFSFTNLETYPNDSTQKIDLILKLTPSKRGDYDLSAELSTLSGSLGNTGAGSLRYRNFFDRGEIAELRANIGIEAQPTRNLGQSSDITSIQAFNTLEYGTQFSLLFPEFVVPFGLKNVPKDRLPRTKLNAGYSFQSRFDYTRSISRIGMSYEWNVSTTRRWSYTPLEIDVVSSRVDSLFAIILENPRNSFLKASFLPHTTALSKLSFAYSPLQAKGKYFSVQTGLELAGNLIDAYNRNFSDKSRPYTLFGQRYFHYAKVDAEARRGITLRKDTRLAFRVGTGVGVPLANSTTLPLEKRYFGGGSNSLRAWQARTLGPGTYTRTLLDPDQFGDVRIEGNIEIRQPLFGVFESAFFVDAGNIWTLNDNSSKGAASNFKASTFLRDLALGTGAGLRLNFELFIIRLDLGLKLYDPSISPEIGSRWSISTWGDDVWNENYARVSGSPYQRLNLNLGIGYPF